MEEIRRFKSIIVVSCILIFGVCAIPALKRDLPEEYFPGKSPWVVQVAQEDKGSISCDVINGESYNLGQIEFIQWNVTGYQNYLFLLNDNEVAIEFGTISSNVSYIIPQAIGTAQGWHAFSLQIYLDGILINVLKVIIEIVPPANFWGLTFPWIIASVAVTSAVTMNVYAYRKKGRSLDQHLGFEIKQIPTLREIIQKKFVSCHSAQADLLDSADKIEVDDWDFISTTRVEKVWVCKLPFSEFLISHLLRPDLVRSTRNVAIDKELTSYLQDISGSLLQETVEGLFVNFTGLSDMERMLIVSDGSKMTLAFLLNAKITKNFFTKILSTLEELKSILEGAVGKEENLIPAILEKNLHISRSNTFIEPPPQTKRIFSDTDFKGENQEAILEDARGLSPHEYEQVLKRIENARITNVPDPLFDEVEDLPEEITKS